MRILFIRHGNTNNNLADARMAIRVAKGQVELQDCQLTELREAIAEGPEEASGDTRLSTYRGGGVAEAERLAAYWAPILRGKAAAGELHVFVSAMHRCLETADPLMRQLELSAGVETRLMEVPGLCSGEDRLFLETEVRPLFDCGEDLRARALLQAHRFRRCGLTRRQVLARFPWAASFSDFPADEDVGWWRGCWERAAETEHRLRACVSWLQRMAMELPENHVVLLFSHGDTIWRLLSALVGIDPSKIDHGTANTSVTSLMLNPHAGETQLDFYNRTPHLVNYSYDARNLEYMQFMGIMSRPVRGNGKQQDLSKGMRDGKLAYRQFLAKL